MAQEEPALLSSRNAITAQGAAASLDTVLSGDGALPMLEHYRDRVAA